MEVHHQKKYTKLSWVLSIGKNEKREHILNFHVVQLPPYSGLTHLIKLLSLNPLDIEMFCQEINDED